MRACVCVFVCVCVCARTRVCCGFPLTHHTDVLDHWTERLSEHHVHHNCVLHILLDLGYSHQLFSSSFSSQSTPCLRRRWTTSNSRPLTSGIGSQTRYVSWSICFTIIRPPNPSPPHADAELVVHSAQKQKLFNFPTCNCRSKC